VDPPETLFKVSLLRTRFPIVSPESGEVLIKGATRYTYLFETIDESDVDFDGAGLQKPANVRYQLVRQLSPLLEKTPTGLVSREAENTLYTGKNVLARCRFR